MKMKYSFIGGNTKMGKKAYFSDDFYFDMGSNLLFYQQKVLPLTTVQRNLLSLLIEKRDQLVSEQELKEQCFVAESRPLAQEITSIRKQFKTVFGNDMGKDFITHCRANYQYGDGSYSLNSRNSVFTIRICDNDNQTSIDDFNGSKFDLITAELFYRRDDIQNEITEIQLQMSQNPNNISEALTKKYLEKTQELASLNSQIHSNKILFLQIVKNNCSADIENCNYSQSIKKAKEFYRLGQINEAINELRSNTWTFETIINCNNTNDVDSFIIRNRLLISYILAQNVQNKFFSIDSINNQIKVLYDEILVLAVQSRNNYDAILDYALFLFRFRLLEESIMIFQKLENLYSLDNSINSAQWSELEYNWGKIYSLQHEASYNGSKAIEHFKRAIDYIIQDDSIQADTRIHILSYIELAKIHIIDSKYADSLFCAFKALTYLESQNYTQDKYYNIWGQIYSLIGKSYQKIDCNKSIDNLLRAAEFYKKCGISTKAGEESSYIEIDQVDLKEELAIIYSNLYWRYYDSLNYAEAEYYLNQSFELKQELYKINPYSYGVTYGIACKYRADFYIQRQDFSLARQELSSSLLAKKYSLSNNSNAHQFTISSTQMSLANLDSIIGDFDAAHRNYSEVLEFRRSLFKSPTPQNRGRLYNVLYNIGFSYLVQTEKTDLAIKYLSEALSLFSFSDLSISSAISPELFCQGLLSIARATRETGDIAISQKYYNDIYSLCLFLESNLQFPTRLSTYIRAVAYYEVGLHLHCNNESNSLLLLNKSLELWEYLLSTDSKWYINDWLLTANVVYQFEKNESAKSKLSEKIESYTSLNAPYMTHEKLFYIF